jgi:hypothetical protein
MASPKTGKMKFKTYLKTTAIVLAVTGIAFGTTSCKKEGCTDTNATNYDEKAKKDNGSCQYPAPAYSVDGLTELGAAYDGNGSQIKVYSKADAFVGYNYLYVLTLDSASGNHLAEGHITVNAMMDMGMHKHSCLVENPASAAPTMNGLYEAQVGFVMPSSAGSWVVTVEYHRHGGDNHHTGSVSIPVNVSQPQNRLMASFVDSTSTSNDKYFLMYALPKNPEVGINDMEVVVFKKQDMMNWPLMSGLDLEIEPSMPSMGHGSPNNEHPKATTAGHYVGKVNYTMTGLWKIDVIVKTNGKTISNNSYFEYTL